MPLIQDERVQVQRVKSVLRRNRASHQRRGTLTPLYVNVYVRTTAQSLGLQLIDYSSLTVFLSKLHPIRGT